MGFWHEIDDMLFMVEEVTAKLKPIAKILDRCLHLQGGSGWHGASDTWSEPWTGLLHMQIAQGKRDEQGDMIWQVP